MNCLCCGKTLPNSQLDTGWHSRCIKRFFGTSALPEIELSEEAFERLATESTGKGYTVPGVQKKLSLHLMFGGKPHLTMLDYPAGFILKPQVQEFAALPESEHLVMLMADASGIKTVPHALVRTGETFSYITRRIDRVVVPDEPALKLAMEDFCQLDLRLTQDKYRGSYERCAKIIKRYSVQPGLDLSEMFLRLVFSFLVGNSDLHLKNFSLIETGEGSADYVLSPAYDLLPVNIILPEDTEAFALTMNGKKRNLHRNDFLLFSDACGMDRKAAARMLDMLTAMRPRFETMISESLMPASYKESFIKLLSERAEALS